MGGAATAGALLTTLLVSSLFPRSGARDTTYAANGIALGAFTAGIPWGFDNVDNFAGIAGHEPTIIHWFEHWLMEFNADYMDSAMERGALPMISWEPHDWEKKSVEQPEYALKKIVAGDHDTYARRWARAAAAWNKPFFLRFAPEMNGDWRPWSPGVNGNTTTQFVQAWRRLHGIFRQEGTTKAHWVWGPIVHYDGATPYKSIYPGDTYVDWVGIDSYNWGNNKPWGWQSFTDIFDRSYRIMNNLTQKPLMIPEIACAEQGGDKADWIKRTFLDDIPKKYPRVQAVMWFDADKETDWRVNSSIASREAYRKVASDPRYSKRLL
jgi:beta-mannanase